MFCDQEAIINEVNVMEESWDYLIVLDACRYDFFSKVYENYLNGELKRFISVGCWTTEWCIESFKDKYNDVIYISANPYINSKFEIKGFKARNHFYEVIDVWNNGWNEELGTVHPKKVNKAVKDIKDKYPGKRLIIHYLQPHAPYLSYDLKNGSAITKLDFDGIIESTHKIQYNKILILNKIIFINKVFNITRYLSHTLLGRHRTYKIYLRTLKLLNFPPINPMDAVQRAVGDRGLRELYIKNLKIVLKYVSELIKDLHGIIIITSDHGELLGEDGYYNHGTAIPRSNPLLMEIPWLKITKKSAVI